MVAIALRQLSGPVHKKQVKPAVVEQGAYIWMAGQNITHGIGWRFDANRKTQRIVGKAGSVMHRLPWQSGPQHPAVAFDNANASGHVVQQLVTGPEDIGCHHRSVILQADPAGHHNGGGQDQFQHTKSIVFFPVVVVQERTTA